MELRVAGIQMEVRDDVLANVATISRAIEEAAAADADILLTPEGSLSGYTPHFDHREVAEALSTVTESATRNRIGLALGTCMREPDGRVYNQLRFTTPDGEALGFHSKVLRCGSLADPPEGEINDYAVSELRTFQFKGITIAGLICNDMWANPTCTPGSDPVLARQLAALGARVIFHAVNGGRDGSPWSREVVWPFHESNLRMRAAASGVWIVTVDNCFPTTLPCSAPSGVIDPRGKWVCRAPDRGEHLFVHSIKNPGFP